MIHLILSLRDPAVEKPEKYRDFIIFWTAGGRRKFEYWEKVNWEIVCAWQYVRDLDVGLEKMRDQNDVFEARCSECGNDVLSCGRDCIGNLERTYKIVPKEEV